MDADVLRKAAFFRFRASKVFGTVLTYLVKQFNQIIQSRKTDIANKHKGAVLSNSPNIIWVKTIDRPGRDRVLSLRNKFNAILEETIADYDDNYILDSSEGVISGFWHLYG